MKIRVIQRMTKGGLIFLIQYKKWLVWRCYTYTDINGDKFARVFWSEEKALYKANSLMAEAGIRDTFFVRAKVVGYLKPIK